ncbi:MAG TPA: hypothetical protein VGL72_05545 [Bryobacteraceae bacterium]|jgi:hypothetical protein
MEIDQVQLVMQFSFAAIMFLVSAAIAMRLHRKLTKPRGTYAKGQPERRKRRRLVLPDPATLHPRTVAPGETI